ncbi:conserved hypothetical protein (putative transposase or invertase), partial [Thermosyntropha lipolytica DSM 11003]
KYMVNIWERELNKENKKELTPIIPVIFYHGEKRWETVKSLADITRGIKEYPELKKYLPLFKHIFYELGELEEIEEVENLGLKVFLLSLLLARGFKNPKLLLKTLLFYLDNIPGDYEYLFIATTIYVFNKMDIDLDELMEYARELRLERREDIMTLAERLRGEGMEKGIEKGIEKAALNALQKGLDIQIIAEITGLSVERIEELKKKLN